MAKRITHTWSKEEKEYLAKITPGHHYREIQKMLNERFEYQFNIEQVKGAIARYKLNTGFTGKFEKGNTPYNKGLKQTDYMTPEGIERSKVSRIKKGNIPFNHKPVGSERVDVKDGYILIKVSEPNVWKLKHRVLWEKVYGPIPEGYTLIFADGDKTNLDLGNLILVSRSELLTMNRYKLIKEDKECTKSGLLVAKVINKSRELKKKGE